MNSDLLAVAARHVSTLFEASLPKACRYHTLEHTTEVTDAALEIGRALGLPESELEILQLAALFHDTGYVEVCDGHESVSVRIATAFLEKEISAAALAHVARCIMATHYPQRPHSLMEEVICDADLIYLGRSTAEPLPVRCSASDSTATVLKCQPTSLTIWPAHIYR